MIEDEIKHLMFFDEAGTGSDVVVISGLIIDNCLQLCIARFLIGHLIVSSVPEKYQKGFVFHAKNLMDSKVWTDWALTDRVEVLFHLMRIPRILNFPIIMGAVRKNMASDSPGAEISKDDLAWLVSFNYALSKADQNIRNRPGGFSKAILIHEAIPQMHERYTVSLKQAKLQSFKFLSDQVDWTEEEKRKGIFTQNLEMSIEGIENEILFHDKKEGTLLQLADVCAFGFRRYLEGLSNGEKCIQALVGTDLVKKDWEGVSHLSCWSQRNPWDQYDYYNVILQKMGLVEGIENPIFQGLMNNAYHEYSYYIKEWELLKFSC